MIASYLFIYFFRCFFHTLSVPCLLPFIIVRWEVLSKDFPAPVHAVQTCFARLKPPQFVQAENTGAFHQLLGHLFLEKENVRLRYRCKLLSHFLHKPRHVKICQLRDGLPGKINDLEIPRTQAVLLCHMAVCDLIIPMQFFSHSPGFWSPSDAPRK